MPSVHFMRRTLPWGILLLLSIGFLSAQTNGKTPLTIEHWRVAGPIPLPLPAMHGDDYTLKTHLAFDAWNHAERRPGAEDRFTGPGGAILNWRSLTGTEARLSAGEDGDAAHPQTALLATWITVDRYMTGTLAVTSPHLVKAWLGGAEVLKQESSGDGDKPVDGAVTLETGTHLLLVETLHDPDGSGDWTLTATLTPDSAMADVALSHADEPRQVMSIGALLDGPKVSGVSIAPSGAWATVTIRESRPPSDATQSWLELRSLPDGVLHQTFRGGTALSGVTWSPRDNRFAYTDSRNGKSTLWVVDLDAGTTLPILRDVEHLGGFQWSPRGDCIYYSVSDVPEADTRGVKRLQTPRDRWPTFRNRGYLYRVFLADGARQRLTAGDEGTRLLAIHPDGQSLLFSTTVDDYENRPYTRTTVWRLHLRSLETTSLFTEGWINAIDWSPDGRTLLVTGSPRLFGGIGVTTPEGVIPNDYDSQAYLYELENGKVSAITREFNPSVSTAEWSDDGKWILFQAGDGQYEPLYRYSVDGKRFMRLSSPVEVISAVDLARNGTAVYYGTSATAPPMAYQVDVPRNRHRLLSDTGTDHLADVAFGEVREFHFTNSDGRTIEGRVYLPPGFDPEHTYPAIVYYYGGTSPVERSFGGRYPKNLFAAQGYVIYVPQPSGATGYGQEFAALHVNDWGDRAAKDIIEGTREFLNAHPFVDSRRVGCIGASYGGFMTMSLLTQTDMFATGISHAGISSLASYWGEGFWGYLYSSAATAESFPWNRPDIYVNRSPLFNADKIDTPLLLLTGDADTNVPRGESDQLYVALKLLGKEVEYVRVADQDHHILAYGKRIIWQKTILAWFDRWLKDQGEWWDALYPAE